MKNGVLIIDDSEDDCKLIVEGLRQAGIKERIIYKLGAIEGLEFLQDHQYDLPKVVIVDMNMPRLDGIIVLQRITEQYSTKVLMYSTVCTEELVKEVKAFGGVDCVKKGTRFSDNLKFARRVLEVIKDFDRVSIL